jgi:ATP-dependent Lon protease
VAGGREKVLAAQRAGLETVVFPKRNDVDLQALPGDVTEGLTVIMGEEIDQLLDIALLPAGDVQ